MQQNNQAITALLQPHLAKLYRFAYRLTGTKADAEDLLQDVLVKVCAKRDELLGIRALAPWLSRVMYNHFIDDKRRYGRMPIKLLGPSEESDWPAAKGVEPDTCAALTQDQARLRAALAKLTEDQRIVVLLHDAEGYKIAEIEALTGAPVGTVKSRLHRARARLAELLKKDGTFSASPACKSSDGVRTDVL